jgi:O-antigen ligase
LFAGAISGLLLLATSGITDELTSYFLRGQSEREIASGSGRIQAFTFLLEVWHENPIFGLGYAAGSRLNLVTFMASSGLGIGAGHDVVSRTLADLGLAGLVAVVMLYASVARRAVQALYSSWDPAQRRNVCIASAIVVLALTGALTSSGIMDPDAKLATAVVVLLKLQGERARRSSKIAHCRRSTQLIAQIGELQISS